MTGPQAGTEGRLPEVVLTAIVSGREISLRNIGAPLVLIFHAQDTARTALEVNRTVRGAYPDAREVVIVSDWQHRSPWAGVVLQARDRSKCITIVGSMRSYPQPASTSSTPAGKENGASRNTTGSPRSR